MTTPSIGQVDHVAITVTDLSVSERFYTEVLGFVVVMVVPDGRICMHPETGFVLGLSSHQGEARGPFSELRAGVDHLGFAAPSRETLHEWARHLEAHGVHQSPIQDEMFGSHLNFRDPDGFALELTTSNELMVLARTTLASGTTTTDDIAAFVGEHVGQEYAVPRMARAAEGPPG